METQLEIKGLRFNDFDQQVCIMANVIKDNLSYWTTLFVDMTSLNHILNLLQKQNPDSNLLDEIVTKEYQDFTEYELSLGQNHQSICSFEEVKGRSKEIRQIRA
jgi:hypothetical protein